MVLITIGLKTIIGLKTVIHYQTMRLKFPINQEAMETVSLSKKLERINKGIKISEEVSVEKWGLDANKYANFYIDSKSFFYGADV